MRPRSSLRSARVTSAQRRRGIKAFALLLICVAALASAEAASRIVLSLMGPADEVRFQFSDVWAHAQNPFHMPDRDLFWRPIPGYSEGAVTIDEEGFRGPAIARQKTSDTFRIVVLGDSVTFGYNVAEEDTYARQLERLLRSGRSRVDGRSRVEVINGGVVGYTSWQGRVLYETRIRRFSPDLVIVQFGYNDHHSAQWSDRRKYDFRYVQTAANALTGSAFYRLAVRLGDRLRGSDLRREPIARVSVDEFASNVLALQHNAARDGARCLFITTPVRAAVPLVENFRAVDYMERGRSRRLWIRQIDFAARMLGRDYGLQVTRHFLDSRAGLERLAHDEEVCRRIGVLSHQYEGLSVFPYLESVCASARGDTAYARTALARSARSDVERRQLEAYFTRLRQLAGARQLPLLDMGHLWPDRSLGVLQDVIHPTAHGHALLAAAIAERLQSTDLRPRTGTHGGL